MNTDKPIKSKVLPLIAGLDKKLLTKFQKQIKKEGNPKRDLMLIFNYCLKHHPNYQTSNFFQKKAFSKIFKEPFDYVRLMRGLSNVFLRLENFLIENEIESNLFFKEYLLAKAYKKNNLDSYFNKLVYQKTASQNSINNINFLEYFHWNHLAYYSGIDTKIQSTNDNLQHANQALDLFFLGYKLRYLCEQANRSSVLGEVYKDAFENFILNYCEKHKDELPILHWIYYHIFLLIRKKEESTFYQIKAKYWDKLDLINKEDQLILLTYLVNHTSNQIRKNHRNFIKEQYLLYQLGIDKEVILINERFVEDQFINLIYVSSYLNEFDWINQFLSKWKKQIDSWLPKSTYHLALARLAFGQKLYHECQDHLQKIDYSNYGHIFRGKPLEIACAYELKEPIFRIETLCKAYENYLRRKEILH